MDVTDRIIAYCEQKKVKQIDLVSAGCGSKGTINNIFLRKNGPSVKFIEAFLRAFPDLDSRWLFTGTGSQEIHEPVTPYDKSFEVVKRDGVIEFLRAELADAHMEIERLQQKYEGANRLRKGQSETKAS